VNIIYIKSISENIEEAAVEFIYCKGVATELLKYGPRDLHAAAETPDPPRVLILVIPGNPGVVGFYKTFMWTLYQAFNRRYPVWSVGHAGHCVPPDTMDMVEGNSVRNELHVPVSTDLLFHSGLRFTITSLFFIRHFLYLYIFIYCFPDSFYSFLPMSFLTVLKSVLLFPTIERMAVTPQGKVMTPLLCNLRYTAYLPVFLLSLLPERLKTSLVHLVLKNVKHLDTLIVPPTASLINVDCVGKSSTFPPPESDNGLVFYYGATDHWCPVQYYYDLRRDFPDGDIRLCERGHRHAFVLDAGQEMGEMTTEWIREELRGL
uniref:Lipid droplet associated hydrolase n=1 Tax=Astyanax mexicanus TaxID=7994 RepID=A0A8B9KF53_ASTMX